MIKGIKWYTLRLSFSDIARGPEESLESHVLELVKKHKLISATVLKEDYHYNLFGVSPSTQLFGGHKGSKPIFMEIFISEIKLDSFLKEIESLAIKGKSNLLYTKHELSAVIGNPSILDKIDEYKNDH